MSSAIADARKRVIGVFMTQGTLALALMVALTVIRADDTREILTRLGSDGPILIAIFIAFASTLALLKFELTELIYVALVITAYMAMMPLLGLVISAWIAVSVAILTRVLSILQIGPVKIRSEDRTLEYVKSFGLFGTYGVPVIVSATLYEVLGGQSPVLQAAPTDAMRVAVCGLAMILTNSLVMFWPARAYGYDVRKIFRLYLIDGSTSVLALPYAVVTALAYGAMGWGAVLALAFTGAVANFIARNLAVTRARGVQQLQRLAALTTIGKTISLRFTTDELLRAIYTECKKSVDCTLFAIALYDEATSELVFELDVREDTILPKERIPVGQGLNSWVIQHHEPLLIGSVDEERRIGVTSVADTKPTESWLGVPMIARDRVIGVISVESYRKNAFNADDILLMTAIANQAAVAIDNAQLYKDLEALTYALEQRVTERTNELREANLRLLAADRSKNQFLANMSHELRTPLNSIIGFSSVLLENTVEQMPPRFYKFLENIHAAGNHLLELINDILDLSKIEAGKMELRPDYFELRDTMAAVERVMRGVAAEARVQIMAKVGDDVPRVRLDEGRLKQILFNLLSNAIKFSPHGGPVHLLATSMPGTDSPLPVDAVKIEVRDQGIGIPPEELQRIFEEFYQTEAGRKSKRGGTGLGLSLTRNFVEMHYGRIEVESNPGTGSCFRLFLPVDYYEAATHEPSAVIRSSSYSMSRLEH
jgi:signal transduction histidine kinase